MFWAARLGQRAVCSVRLDSASYYFRVDRAQITIGNRPSGPRFPYLIVRENPTPRAESRLETGEIYALFSEHVACCML
jgi:hypothetical protein